MNRKNLVITILLSAFLLALVCPMTRSQTSIEYDPWADINDDGKIDMRDIAYIARLFGTAGDPTKPVYVTNWPQDRPPSIKRGLEKIVVQETLYPGIYVGIPGYGSVVHYWFNFKPEGKLVNVTEVYVNIMWKADVDGTAAQPHAVYLIFWNVSDPFNFTYFKLGPLGPGVDVKNDCFKASEENPQFDFSLITEGINQLSIERSDSYGNYIYILKLELFIEYYYLG